jgi:glycosyltransferase involved in cell wall biosynthesis
VVNQRVDGIARNRRALEVSVAIVHDYVTQRGGAERVLLSILKAYPEAPLYTSIYSPKTTYPEFQRRSVQTSILNRFPLLRSHHRLAFPLLAPTLSRLRVRADVVLCSSSGWAHGVSSEGRKIVFCYAPARWLYQTDAYLGQGRLVARSALKVLGSPLARWDRRAAFEARRYLAISTLVQRQIREHYGIEAEVLFPPHSMDPQGEQVAVADVEGGYFLCVSRLLPYKHVDTIIEAFRNLPRERLIVVGRGPEERRLRSIAPRNVSLLGTVNDEELRWLYANASGLLAASFEDYGLTPLEAAAFGKPTAALRWGGYLDTVKEGTTGVYFDKSEPKLICRAVVELAQGSFAGAILRTHAAAYSEGSFIRRLRALVAEEGCDRKHGNPNA